MIKTKHLTISKQKDIIKRVMNMEKFIKSDLNIETIVFACFVARGTGDAVHKNRPSHGLAFHTSGEKEYNFSDGTKLLTKPNTVIYLPKGSDYVVNTKVQGDCFAINFDISPQTDFKPFVMPVKNTKMLEHFKTAEKIWTAKKPGYMFKCKAELYNILYLMQEEFLSVYTPTSKYEIIRPAVDYIHRYYPEKLLNVSELSRMCGITPEYFRRLFGSFFGVSPIKYINALKLARAEELLSSQMYSVTEAAQMSGYTDMSHFSREFKKHTGISPTEVMKK